MLASSLISPAFPPFVVQKVYTSNGTALNGISYPLLVFGQIDGIALLLSYIEVTLFLHHFPIPNQEEDEVEKVEEKKKEVAGNAFTKPTLTPITHRDTYTVLYCKENAGTPSSLPSVSSSVVVGLE